MAVSNGSPSITIGLIHIILYHIYIIFGLIERAVQSLKDRTKAFDDHFPYMKEDYELDYKWTGILFLWNEHTSNLDC